ncbi:hypothetical protein SEA_PICARD_47 [Streptomyces phage Picard]|uniref:Uncharacterized protein n=1 Tax=Streptomyces phage Picard TaxID=1920311 RepID=A0A1J0MC28_9CAUD|nr:hypothetical protein HOR45_gp47 [Streptomyces phage Picard]APD18577.1 hypothetical protein SEA_PICARD_47 [Streptomyces phage Picard]
MTRTPGRVAVASLATHRLIVAVPNAGPAEVASSLPRPAAADMLRRLADHLDSPAGRCETARATGRPCPVHDAQEQHPVEGDLDRALDDLLAGLDAHLATETATPPPGPAPAPEGDLDADTVRYALDFNDGDADQALATLRDVLLDTSLSRTPDQALAAARILLAAHARQIEALIEADYRATRTRWGVTRSSRGLLTGHDSARKIVAAYAAGLDRDQALAEQPTP